VQGVVISADDGQPIIGASVLVKGTTLGTITDFDGKFKLTGIPGSAKALRVSYVGMITQEVALKEGLIRVELKSDAKALDEVVVTAMGIKRSEKALGYAASTVSSENIVAAQSGSMMSGLSGKIAGVNISQSGTAGSSQKVIVRGYSSFGSNQPLYVIDGIPMSNSTSLSNVTEAGGISASDQVDFGNGANDINPDDVESVTILKGASATALYGSRAANGVIMITTKQAKQEKLSITYDGSFMASNVLRVQQEQDRFGQGWPDWSVAENGSWGPRLDGRTHEWGSYNLSTPMTKPFSFVKDNLRKFYTTGFDMNNNVSVRTGTDKLGLRLSYGNTSSRGILPNNADKYSRNTFAMRGNINLGKFSADVSLNYVRKDMTKAAAGQGKDGSTMQQELIQHPVDVDYSIMKDYNDERYNADNYYTWYAQNPYWVLDNNRNSYQDDRVYGKIELSYEIIPGLKAVGRLGGDFTNSRQRLRTAKLTYTDKSYSVDGGKSIEKGTYTERTDNNDQIDVTALLNANYNIHKDITLGGTLGWNLNQRKSSYLKSRLEGLSMPGWYNLQNGIDKPVSTSIQDLHRIIGLFGQVEFGYKNYWYVNFSGRNDWSSTLPIQHNSYIYGGINTSLILSELFPTLKGHAIDFLKIRAAWGVTGNDADTYQTIAYYKPTHISSGYGYIDAPLNGVLGLSEYNRQPNNSLKPEKTSEWELGLTAHFLDNRIGLDFAYYDKLTKDQIIAADIAPETRYTTGVRNVGKIQNRGIEVAFNFTPIRTKEVVWDLGVTFSKNWSEVKALWDEGGKPVTEYVLTNAYSVNFVAKVGEPLGIFQVPALLTVDKDTDPNYGKVVVDANGIPKTNPAKKATIGSSAPDFNMGFTTSLSYKGFTLSGVLDWRKGGYMYSYTAQLMHFVGNATRTVYNDRQAFLVPNSVYQLPNGTYIENNIPVTDENMYSYFSDSYSDGQFRNFVIPKGYVKLRELVLSYSFPKKWMRKIGLQQLDLSVIGRNLFMWTPKGNNYVDPETTTYGNDIASELGEFAALPSTRSIGAGIKIVF
jgi:TonB-linked SusC/RagA family outer membrane protein